MATHSSGDNKRKTLSMDPELYDATLDKWGKKKPFSNFAKYIQHLIIEDLDKSGDLPESFRALLIKPVLNPVYKGSRSVGNLNEKDPKKKGPQA